MPNHRRRCPAQLSSDADAGERVRADSGCVPALLRSVAEPLGRQAGYLARFAPATVLPRRRGSVRLLMPAVAAREALEKAALTSSRTGARSATTRIP
jgi:hypothetical protein